MHIPFSLNQQHNLKFSIVIPVYNKGKYLSECIRSIQNQTYKNFELLLVDNNSTDNCPEIIKSVALNDKRVIALHETEQGPAQARNLGIKVASGDYICFVDADDVVENDMLAKINEVVSKNRVDIVIFGIGYWYADKNINLYSSVPEKSYVLTEKEKNKDEVARNLFFLTQPSMCTKAFSLNFIRKNNLSVNSQIKCAEDLLFSYSAMIYAQRIAFIDKILYTYRQCVEDSLSAKSTYVGTQILESLSLLDDVAKTTNSYIKYHIGILNLTLEHVMYNLCEAGSVDEFYELYNAFKDQRWEEIEQNCNSIRPEQQQIYDLFKRVSDPADLLFEHLQEARGNLLWYEKQCRKLEEDIADMKDFNERKIKKLMNTKAYRLGVTILEPFYFLKGKLERG